MSTVPMSQAIRRVPYLLAGASLARAHAAPLRAVPALCQPPRLVRRALAIARGKP